jgi:hypothetical protein
MTITLYKNTQTAGYDSGDVYTDRWELSPYRAPTMFHEGETTGQCEFVIPKGYTVNGDSFFKNGKDICILITSSDGTPRITAKNYPDNGVPLYRADEPVKEEEAAVVLREGGSLFDYIPGMKDGEPEIF